jgi:hypothetical protein
MIGPVQLMMLGYPEHMTEVPGEVRVQIEALNATPAVRLLDVLQISKDRKGRLTERPVEGFLPEGSTPDTGNAIRKLLTSGRAAGMLGQNRTSGTGYLYQKASLPDISVLPGGINVLILLLEHRWAADFWMAMHGSPAYPVGDMWLGHEGLEAAGVPLDRP